MTRRSSALQPPAQPDKKASPQPSPRSSDMPAAPGTIPPHAQAPAQPSAPPQTDACAVRRLRTIFLSFFKIGLFTFGGGYAMLPLIEQELIQKRHWIEHRDFLDLLTLAQSVPGPIAVNTSVFVGYKMRGLRGAAAALLGTVLPSFVIILTIALFFADIRRNPVVDAAFKGMRPAVVALIIGPVLSLARGLRWPMYFVITASALAVWLLGWSPVYILAAAAAAGIAWALLIAKKAAP